MAIGKALFDRSDQGRAPAAHEREHDDRSEDGAEDEVDVDLVQRGVDVVRLIAEDLHHLDERALGVRQHPEGVDAADRPRAQRLFERAHRPSF
mgnify:CR=1 FL=1